MEKADKKPQPKKAVAANNHSSHIKAAPPEARIERPSISGRFSYEKAREAVILSEIIGPPLARRRYSENNIRIKYCTRTVNSDKTEQ